MLIILGRTNNFTISIPIEVIILLIVLSLIICILLFLYYRFNHFRKRVYFNIDSPENSEVLGPKEWEHQMYELALKHKQVKMIRYNFVIDDYNQIAYKKLNKIRNNISRISTDLIAMIPSARWLFDNFQMMYREIKKVRTSGTGYEILPILKTKEFRGFPRIYIIAKKMTALSGGHLDEENIAGMLAAYQKVIPLTDKELWVLPEMLGFCLLENIIEIAQDILRVINIKSRADRFVKKRLGELPKDMQGRPDIRELLSDIGSDSRKNYSYHAHVIYLLRNMSYDDISIQKYIDYHFNNNGKQVKPSQIFKEEGRIESMLETKIRALIISLRLMNELDVENFYEKTSYLEQVLSQDPDGIYPKLDSESKGMYRGIIVRLSLRYGIEEQQIVNDCLSLATSGREDLHCSHHVGTYLLGKGYPLLKAKVLDKPFHSKLKKNNGKGFCYFLSISAFFIVITCFLVYLMNRLGRLYEIYQYVLFLLVSFPLLIGIAMEVTNFIFTRRIKVKKIPSLDYLDEIPDSARTFVVMPVIVSSKEQGLDYFDRLLKHYLANRQSNLYFGLLIDYKDYPEKFSPEDEEIENALIGRVNELNELYYSEHQRFSLFIRYRMWNKSENCYMGWERKRGKLEEFNNLLNGAPVETTSFSIALSDKELLTTFRYVITLDADTNLIRENASKLVGLIDHPLNQPVIDPDSKKVKEGYVIIQPSVRNHIVDKKGSRFAEIYGGQSGLAHYSAVISDIYQDIFDQGIYTGKGIYEVKAFHMLLNKVIPENQVLSHDLLESCYAKTAFSSSAKIMDSFPSSVISYAKREHRWIRGDWQLLPWLLTVKKQKGQPLCALSRWKIFDNLRRSMVPLSKVLLIIANLAFMPRAFYLWLPFVFFNDLFNLLILLIATFKQKLFRSRLVLVYKDFMKELGIMVERAFIELALTPYRAYLAEDAKYRTLYRIYISKCNLLRWNTAESVDASILNTKKGYFLSMWSSVIPAIILLILLPFQDLHPVGYILYAAVIVGWAASFYLAYEISQPKEKTQMAQKDEDHELLLETARVTWQFFKELSTKENNWLCPDNYQLSYVEKLSDKTSPTNIGLQFLAILSARDFGFETLSSTIQYTENLLDTVQKLQKWKGHLYNWYQVKTLDVLNPAYISTVDSGNFLGHLITLKNGLLEQMDHPIFPDSLISELKKTLNDNHCAKDLKDSYETIGEFTEDIADIWEDLSCDEPRGKENSHCLCELLSNIEIIVKEASDFKLKGYRLSDYPTLKQLENTENKKVKAMIGKIRNICYTIDRIVENADFTFLFNKKRMLFHIGYHVPSRTLDTGCYDLMASESALTSFLAVAKGEVPVKHWHKLGRPLTLIKGIPCYVSWSGTMFEYLMPNLVLREYEGSVYAQSSKAAVLQQIYYAKEMSIPWGISESQYYRFDLNSNYQYKAFGVPKLRLSPVRRNSMVAAPYATFLALDYAKNECIENLNKLKELGMFGKYGFYEAIDYNSPNTEEMTPYCIVRSFMAHHQGMILVSINNYLNQDIMKMRFHTEAMVKATEVLLEEKRQTYLISLAKKGYTIRIGKINFKEDNNYSNRYVNSVAPRIPVAGLLSNNKYCMMITSDGDGFSSFQNLMLYRWRADLYANTGNYIYIKDISKGRLWSAAFHPVKAEPDEYQVVFSPHQVEFSRRDGDISSHTVISLSAEHNLEIRKVTLTNHGKEIRQFELTSYLEVVLDTHMAELSHPAFNKLFIESEYLEEQSVFLSRRRGGKAEDSSCIMHMVKSGTKLAKQVEYENDRLKFIGRNNSPENPDAVVNSAPFSNHAGFCNDPIMSLRVNIILGAEETASIFFITGICQNKEEALKIGDEFSNIYRIDDICEKFRLQRDIELKYLEITKTQLNAFQNLISPIYYPNGLFRGSKENIRRNFKNQSFLWRFGVSGDNPILLLSVKSIEEAGIIKDVLKAFEYLRINRVVVDLIILSEAKHGYMQELDDLVNDLTSTLKIYDSNEDKQSLFLLHSYDMIPAEIDLLFTVARVVFTDKTGIYFGSIREKQQELIEE